MARAKKSCICTNMSELAGTRKRRAKKGTTKKTLGAVAKGCKLIKTKNGVRKGCYNSKGQFRFKKM